MNCERNLKKIYAIFEKLKTQHKYEEIVNSLKLIKSVFVDGLVENIYVSFNGGKDATVVLFLTLFALKELDQSISIKCLYFEQSEPFEEVDEFMKQMRQLLGIRIYTLKTKKYQIELQNFNKENQLDYIIMGSRRDDPGCANLAEIAESDVHKGYPKFKRVNPIINWSYQFLWEFIIKCEIPYCILYDQGYTSLGNKNDTRKNEALYDETTKSYKPAYLASQKVERDCRKVKL